MKKLFSMVSIVIFVFTLVGCDAYPIEEQFDELLAELESKEETILTLEQDLQEITELLLELQATLELTESQKAELQSMITVLETEIYLLEEDIQELQEQIYDNVITVSFDNGYDMYKSGTIAYNDDFEGTLLDLIDADYDVHYYDTEYGAFIYGIAGITTMQGNYIAFSKNGEASMVGVDAAIFEDGDIFTFELTWWDTGLQTVYEGIQRFLNNHADDYVNETTANYNVVVGLKLLGVLDEYITQTEMEALVDTTNLTTNTDYFKAIIRLQAVGSDVSQLMIDLAEDATISDFGGTAYALLALNSDSHSADFSTFEANAISSYNLRNPEDLGLDAGGITLVALSEYSNDNTVQSHIDNFAFWIHDEQLPSGGVMTRDLGWGSTENAASISQVIMGLVANDLDPRGVDYTKGTNNLISRLLEFQTDTGSFDWVLTDEVEEDLAFSTPQAFLALVTYQTYVNRMHAVNPYANVIIEEIS